MPPGRLSLPEDTAEDLLGEERCHHPGAEPASGARPTVLSAGGVGGEVRAAGPWGGYSPWDAACSTRARFCGFCPSAVSVSPCCFPSGAIVPQAGPGVWQLLALALCGRGSLARACESRGVFNSSWQPLPDEQERLQQPWAALALPWARAPMRQASVLGCSQPFLQVCRSHRQPVPGNRKPKQIFTLFYGFLFNKRVLI